MELLIEELQNLCSEETIVTTMHAIKRFEQRNIYLQNIIDCIMSGEIIEQYPDDYPYPSCLILGNRNTKPLHVVIASNAEELFIVTAYYPSDEEWENDLKTRKERLE